MIPQLDTDDTDASRTELYVNNMPHDTGTAE